MAVHLDEVEIVEMYLPARLDYLANLYSWLREQLYSHPRPMIGGFSIYEVNGAFRGEQVYEERTTVIRMIFPLPHKADQSDRRAHDARVTEIGETLRGITNHQEEEIWLIRSPAYRNVI